MGVVELDGERALLRVSSHSKSKSQPQFTIEVSNTTSVAMMKGGRAERYGQQSREANEPRRRKPRGGSLAR
jgi:hypothetical protein